MFKIIDIIKTKPYDQLNVLKLAKNNKFEILVISLEKGAIFPQHSSPTNVELIVLEGDIVFHINDEAYHLTKQQCFSFPKQTEHWVSANENSKFLIIR